MRRLAMICWRTECGNDVTRRLNPRAVAATKLARGLLSRRPTKRMTTSIASSPARFSSLIRVAIVFIVAGGAVACTSPTASTPTPPAAPATITESFSGGFSQLGNAAFPFTVSATGPVQVSLTAVAPLSTMALGIDIGHWDGTTCTIGVAENDHAKSGVTALSGTATSGTYCVQVSDSGNVPPGSMVT